jgi:hypothetical protein
MRLTTQIADRLFQRVILLNLRLDLLKRMNHRGMIAADIVKTCVVRLRTSMIVQELAGSYDRNFCLEYPRPSDKRAGRTIL